MADYYTHFSVLLPAPKVAERIQLVFAWYQSKVQESERYSEYMDYDENPLVGFNFELSDGGIWVYDEESGDVEKAAAFIQEYLEDMDMTGGILMTWANTCSRPRINAFSGGGVIVTRDQMSFASGGDLLQDASENGVEIINEFV